MNQEEALRLLQEYGDKFLDEEGYKEMKEKSTSKGKKSKKIIGGDQTIQKSSSVNNEISARKKKRLRQKKKKLQNRNSELNKSESNVLNKNIKISKRDELLNLKAMCELSSIKKPANSESSDLKSDPNLEGSNKILLTKPNAANDGRIIVHFKQHVPKKKKSSNDFCKSNEDGESVKNVISMGKARHQVLKFGISGFDPEKKKKAEIDMAIKLGAKPPKKKPINYKDYLENRKTNSENGLTPKKGIVKPIKKPKLLDGQIGRYKDGIQFIKSTDLKKIKSKLRR